MSMREWFIVRPVQADTSTNELRSVARVAGDILSGSTLLWVRVGNAGLQEFIFSTRSQVERVEKSMGVKCEPCDWPVLPENVAVAHSLVQYRSRLNVQDTVSRLHENVESQRGTFEGLVEENSFVAVTVRRAGLVEDRRIRDWVADETNTSPDANPLVERGRMLMRVSVGCARSHVGEFASQVGAVFMPVMSSLGWHFSVPRLGGLLSSLLVAGLCAGLMVHSVEGWWLFAVLMLIALVAGVVYFSGRSVWESVLTKPHHYWSVWPRHRMSRLSARMGNMGVEGEKRAERAYPLHRSTLVSPALTLINLMVPSGVGQSLVSGDFPAPDVLTRSGVLIGVDSRDRQVFLDSSQLYRGLAIMGKTGSGKSVLMLGVQKWADQHRSDSAPNVWGADSRLFDFVMKDTSNVRLLQQWRKERGLPAGRVMSILNPQSPCLDFLGLLSNDSARVTGVRIASNMQYAFPAGDILKDSLSVLGWAFTCGVFLSRFARTRGELLRERFNLLSAQFPMVAGLEFPVSPVGWAHYCLAGSDMGVQFLRMLAVVLPSLTTVEGLSERERVDLQDAVSCVRLLTGGVTDKQKNVVSDSQVSQHLQAARNKTSLLLTCEQVFTPTRRLVSWEQVVRMPGDYHIIFAPSREFGYADLSMESILASWALHQMWETMRAQCEGWQQAGKHTMVSCDELSLLAGADASTVVALKEQGRSFGLLCVFATQYPQQLPANLLESFIGYDTVITFDHPDGEVANMIATKRFMPGIDGATIQGLHLYHAAVRTRTVDVVQPGFIVKVADFTNVHQQV